MDFQKGRILLNKINTLYKSMETTPDEVSAIERDLLKSYLQELYATTLDTSSSIPEPTPKSSPKPQPKPKPEEPIEVIRSTPKPTPPPRPKPVYEKPRVIEVPESLMSEVESTPVKKEKPTPPPTPPSTPAPKPSQVSGEMEELFEQHQAKELSDKLSELPIVDLNKSMGLNERIFTINELFNGDQQHFQKTMSELNGFSNFEDAKNYLIANVAGKYEWAEERKRKKARNFIKLVRRRFKS